MALCDECGCYDDNWVDGEDISEEELEKDPLYEPHRYYYWHGDIQEDYQMPKGYECLCERCFGDFLSAGEIIEKYEWKTNKLNPNWNDETMGWFIPVQKVSQGFPIPLKMGLYYKSNQRSKHATYTNCKQHDRGRNF